MSKTLDKVIVVAGATASGKSALAVKIAKEFGGAIVSCDSMQVYKTLDIGTAKESLKIRQEIPHYLLDIAQPDEEFSAAKYKQLADSAVSEILKKGMLPVIAGGTGLYLDALLFEMSFSGADKNSAIRDKLKTEVAENGLGSLYEQLKTHDPESAEKIHANDEKRIIRALEIFYATGVPKSKSVDKKQKRYDFLGFMPDMPRETLYERINKRVDIMFEEGLVDEVKAAAEKYGFDTQSMQAIGYKEFSSFFAGTASLDDTKELIKKNTRNYAKRQLTWFKKSDLTAVDPENTSQIFNEIRLFLSDKA